MNAVYPLMIRGDMKRIFKNSFLFLFLVSLGAAVVVWVGAPLLTVIKSDFRESILTLRVLSFGLPFFFTTAATMWALIVKKKQVELAAIYGVSMLVNILGNILFVPTHGFMAAAWMTVVGEGVVLLLSSIVLIKNL
jgi:O-antigen/teichoic acid export membrane protein